jgi:hypothetical protein
VHVAAVVVGSKECIACAEAAATTAKVSAIVNVTCLR